MTDRIVSGTLREEDLSPEGGLRPRRLDEYIGQDKVKENLRIGMEAAKQRGEPFDHVLLYGPPGAGKIFVRKIPDPGRAVADDDLLARPAPAPPPGFAPDTPAESGGVFDRAGVAG